MGEQAARRCRDNDLAKNAVETALRSVTADRTFRNPAYLLTGSLAHKSHLSYLGT